MTVDRREAVALMDEGTTIFHAALDGLSDQALAAPTALAGWNGTHVVAHVAANADALVHLADRARTGVETPMYSSPGKRNADIETGALLPAGISGGFYSGIWGPLLALLCYTAVLHPDRPIGLFLIGLVALKWIAIVLAVLNLVLDFDYVEKGIAQGAPARESWRGAFGLTVTMVWLYVEMLRLLSYLRR